MRGWSLGPGRAKRAAAAAKATRKGRVVARPMLKAKVARSRAVAAVVCSMGEGACEHACVRIMRVYCRTGAGEQKGPTALARHQHSGWLSSLLEENLVVAPDWCATSISDCQKLLHFL